MLEKHELVPKSKGGGSYITLPPIFLNNGLYIFISSRNIIYCYNSKTGKRFLEYKGLDHDIVGFGVTVVEECDYLFACSATGVIATWKVENALRIKKKELFEGKQVIGFKLIKNTNHALVLLRKKERVNFMLLNLDNMLRTKLKAQLVVEDPFKWDVGGSLDNVYCCIIKKKIIYNIDLKEVNGIHTTKNNVHMTCVACHPENGWVLIGDAMGRVCLWYNLMDKNAKYAVYHWHTLPVETICFSSSATHFYSGGSECVLVKWTLDKPHEKKFLPRVNNEIKQISVATDNLYLAFATKDNAINVIDPQFNYISTIQHLVLNSHFKSGIRLDSRTKSLVMNGVDGHLQFYSPHEMNLLYNLDIVGANKLTQERHENVINIEVVEVAIDRLGLWLATYEEYDDKKENCYESRLKFFEFSSSKQSFVLNTSIEDPHNHKLLSINFQPAKSSTAKACCVTIGEDKTFKIWKITEDEELDKTRIYWHCVAAGYYKGLSPKSLSFSFDGSLLAVTFDKILTTWLPNTCEFKCSLVHPIHKETLLTCAFGTGSDSHLVVCTSKHRIFVWNLLTLSLVWTVSIKIKQLVSDSLVPFMGILTYDNSLYIFEPSSSVPIYTNSNLVPIDKNILSAVFWPTMLVGDTSKNWYYKAQLFFIDSEKELFCLEADNRDENIHELIDESLFTFLTPQVRNKKINILQPVTHNYKKANSSIQVDNFLINQAHLMPSMAICCSSFLLSMVAEKQSKEKTQMEAKIEKIQSKEGSKKSVNINTNFNISIASAFL